MNKYVVKNILRTIAKSYTPKNAIGTKINVSTKYEFEPGEYNGENFKNIININNFDKIFHYLFIDGESNWPNGTRVILNIKEFSGSSSESL